MKKLYRSNHVKEFLRSNQEFIFHLSKPVLFALLILTIFSSQSFSQLQDKEVRPQEKEFFFIDPMVFYSKDEMKARLDVYIEIPLDNLQFKKNYSTKDYDASINYKIKVTNLANEIVVNESIKDYVSTSKDAQKSLEESAKFIVKEFYLNPGAYSLEVTLKDINTNKEETLSDKIKIIDFSLKNVSFSDIMLVSNLKIENGKKVITPLIDKNIDNLQEIYLFFEVYNSQNKDVLSNYQYKITGAKEKIYEKGSYQYTLTPGINKFFEKIPTDNLVFGDYKLEITDISSGELIAEKDFSNKLNGMPVNSKDMNLMISQLLYIASGEEYSKIKNAPTEELKEKYFIEYWRSKDPSPNTTKNELMIEYYNRIEVANERYSHYIDGWKTDMGMVYIIYGEPNSIDRVPFAENSKPYEIWQYYTDNKEFIFFDESGFGDYKLAIPIWDDRGTRIRN
ncbi:MAG: GWxTD domain-containing protein [Ignavibacteriae bacterium]|nr:GWxTD domain-containing protein [Ignavibacteriota bacterium]